jgi:hypothetical protein
MAQCHYHQVREERRFSPTKERPSSRPFTPRDELEERQQMLFPQVPPPPPSPVQKEENVEMDIDPLKREEQRRSPSPVSPHHSSHAVSSSEVSGVEDSASSDYDTDHEQPMSSHHSTPPHSQDDDLLSRSRSPVDSDNIHHSPQSSISSSFPLLLPP